MAEDTSLHYILKDGDAGPRLHALETRIRRCMAQALAKRLKYASDDFNAERFTSGITGVSVIK